jgi:hypothetical protein
MVIHNCSQIRTSGLACLQTRRFFISRDGKYVAIGHDYMDVGDRVPTVGALGDAGSSYREVRCDDA